MALPPKKAPAKAPIKAAAKAASAPKKPAAKTVDFELVELQRIAKETLTEQGYAWVNPDSEIIQKLQNAQLIILNIRMIDEDGNIAAKATESGLEKAGVQVEVQKSMFAPAETAEEYEEESEEFEGEEGEEGEEEYEEEGEHVAPVGGFVIEDNIPINAVKLRKRASIYPFDALKVGQSFFIAATDDRPDPAKSLASTVANASKRYALPTGETKISARTGKEVQILKYTRKFTIREVEGGARVWRKL